MASKISTDVSPSLSPDALLAHVWEGSGATRQLVIAGDDDPIGQQAWAAARNAQRTLYDSLDVVSSAARLAAEGGVEQRAGVAADMNAKVARVAASFDAHYATVAGAAEKFAANIDKSAITNPKTDARTASELSEVRTYIANLPESKRMSFIHSAIDQGDIQVAFAVTSGSHWVLGSDRNQAAECREFCAQQFAKRDWQALRATKSILTALDNSAKIFSAAYKKIVPVVPDDPATVARRTLVES